MASGKLRIGSREPVSGLPAWVTPEVVRGGFATGEPAAGGAVDRRRDGPSRGSRPTRITRGTVRVVPHRARACEPSATRSPRATTASACRKRRRYSSLPGWDEQVTKPLPLHSSANLPRSLIGSGSCGPRVPTPSATSRWSPAKPSVTWPRHFVAGGKTIGSRRCGRRSRSGRLYADELLMLFLQTVEDGRVSTHFNAEWLQRAKESLDRYREFAARHTRCSKHRRQKENLHDPADGSGSARRGKGSDGPSARPASTRGRLDGRPSRRARQ